MDFDIRRFFGRTRGDPPPPGAGDYTEQQVSRWEASAYDSNLAFAELAAVEIAAGLVGRAFASATVQGVNSAMLSPDVLMVIGRELIRQGEQVLLIDGYQSRFRLRIAGSWDVYGEPRPEGWTYRVHLWGPSGTFYSHVPGAAVVHCRVNCDPARPYQGQSPFKLSRQTAQTAQTVETSLRKEYRIPPSRIVPLGGTPKQSEDATTALRRGGVMATSEGKPTTLTGDSRVKEIGPKPDQATVQLRKDLMFDLLAAAGFPPALADSRADGTSRRESYRQMLHSTLQPLAAVVQGELRDKLDSPDLTISFRRLGAADIASKARSLKQLTEAGLTLDQALEIVALVESTE